VCFEDVFEANLNFKKENVVSVSLTEAGPWKRPGFPGPGKQIIIMQKTRIPGFHFGQDFF
jgi:hypothetical protein